MKKSVSNAVVKVFRAFAFWIIRIFALVVFNVHVHVEGDKPEGGAIVLCTHHTIFDFTFLTPCREPYCAQNKPAYT